MEELTKGSKNVVGIGNDLVRIERIRVAGERYKEHFFNRVFTEAEKEYCLSKSDPYPYFAVRFAAKEAVSKAFGTGIGEALSWKSISVVKGEKDEPIVELDEKGRKLLNAIGGKRVLISLSHEGSMAQAIVVVVSE